MAWLLVEEVFDQAFRDSNTGQNSTRKFLAVSDTAIADNDDVLLADDGSTSIPLKGAAWSVSRSGLTVDNRRVKELDNGKTLFHVFCEYLTPSGTGTTGSDDPDPTARPWEIATGTLKEERNIEKTKLDVIGSGLGDIELNSDVTPVNAASDPLEVPGIKRTTILTLSKNYAGFTSIHASIQTLNELKAFEGKLNDDAETIAGMTDSAWRFIIDEINAVNARENEIDYIRVTYRIIHDPDTHIRILLNAGLNEIKDDAGTKKRVPILTAKGTPIKKPALLDVNGAQVAALDPAVAVATGTYVAAGVDDEVSYTNLGLPTSFN